VWIWSTSQEGAPASAEATGIGLFDMATKKKEKYSDSVAKNEPFDDK
jgi:hypothetical protein